MASMSKRLRGIGRSIGLVTNHKYKTLNNFRNLTYDDIIKISPSEIKVKNINNLRPELRQMFGANSKEYSAIKFLLGMKPHMSRNNSLRSHSSKISRLNTRNSHTNKQVQQLKGEALESVLEGYNKNMRRAKNTHTLKQRLNKL
jgi:hypothetical protein